MAYGFTHFELICLFVVISGILPCCAWCRCRLGNENIHTGLARVAWGNVRTDVSGPWVLPFTGTGVGNGDQRLLKISNGRIIGQLNLVMSSRGKVPRMLRLSMRERVGYQRTTEAGIGMEDFQVKYTWG